MRTALEYTVDLNGRVETNGTYRVIREAEWDNLQPLQRAPHALYGKVIDEVQAGRIIAIPARTCRSGWNIARTLRLNAERLGVPIEIKRGRNHSGDVVMARLDRSYGGSQ